MPRTIRFGEARSGLSARAWGRLPSPVSDIGPFYGAGGRTLLPIGWVAASLCAQLAEDLSGTAEACSAIRRNGACVITLEQSGA